MKSKAKPKVKSEVKKKEKKTEKKNDLEKEKSKDSVNELNSIKLPQPLLKKKSSIRSGIKNKTSAKSVRIMDNQSIKEEEKSNNNFPKIFI